MHGGLDVAKLECFKSLRGKTYKLRDIVMAADERDYRRTWSKTVKTLEEREGWAAIAAMPADLKQRAEFARAAYDSALLRGALQEMRSFNSVAVDNQLADTCRISDQAHITLQRGIGALLDVNGAAAILMRASGSSDDVYYDGSPYGAIEMHRDDDGRPQQFTIRLRRIIFMSYCH
jgi:hypothetical protein